MKKRPFLLLLFAVLILSAMIFPASADGQSIKIENAVQGRTYTLYKIFSLNYSVDDQKYNYTVEDAWRSFFTNGAGRNYIQLKNDHPNWIKVDEQGNVLDEDARLFAQEALSYAQVASNGVHSAESITASSSLVQFTDLHPGYYLVGSDRGYLCILDTLNNQNLTLREKNSPPNLEKLVTVGNGTFSKNNSASIGDELKFQATIQVGAGTTNYVFHDIPDEGISLDLNSIQIEDSKNGNDFSPVDSTKFTLISKPANCNLHCEFEVEFDNAYVQGVSKIRITYSGKLNSKAKVVGLVENAENKNAAKLIYNSGEISDYTSTKTYGFDLIKQNVSNKRLAGAQFKLYDGQNNEIKLVLDNGIYRPQISPTETLVEYIESNDTHLRIAGLGNGTYYLEETKAPTDYNRLEQKETITIDGESIWEKVGDDTTGIRILNQMGTQLPSTGGTGTTVFYILGGGIAVAALVLLIVKKRMDREA